MSNPKVHPLHYNDTDITPFDIIDDWNLDFYLGTTIKYIKRAGNKPNETAIDDLEKAIDYLKEKIDRLLSQYSTNQLTNDLICDNLKSED